MKKSLTESKVIRFYMLLWGAFVSGILIALPFSETQSQWRYVALAGFLLSAGSFIFAVGTMSAVQNEIRARYPQASNGEKRFLMALFYFVREIFLLMGVLILLSSSLRKDTSSKDVVEVSGRISSIEVVGKENPSLKIAFENNSNQYGINTFKIPDEKLQQIENELQVGASIAVLVRRDDENIVNNPYVQIYGIKTETKTYLSIDEYNKADSANNFYGYVLGYFFTGSGLIYLLTGKIKTNQGQVTLTRQGILRRKAG